jgi:hypothetical protein
MSQGNRTAAEKREFKIMLPNINILYLGASVLALLDLSYMSRFWTQVTCVALDVPPLAHVHLYKPQADACPPCSCPFSSRHG